VLLLDRSASEVPIRRRRQALVCVDLTEAFLQIGGDSTDRVASGEELLYRPPAAVAGTT
jgi:hypothetical protein